MRRREMAEKGLGGVAAAKEDIVTASDISSVDLDSDDSCFAATVEVIKLAPVKKQLAEASERSQVLGNSESRSIR